MKGGEGLIDQGFIKAGGRKAQVAFSRMQTVEAALRSVLNKVNKSA
jgi:hypothetical protein